MPLIYCDVQIKVPAHAWRCNVDQIDGLVVTCLSILSYAHAENHPRRTKTRTSAERGMLGFPCSQPSGALHTVWGSPSCISRHALSSCGLAPRTGHRLLRIHALTPWTIITRSLIAKKELSATRSLSQFSHNFGIFSEFSFVLKKNGKGVQRRSWAPTTRYNHS